MRFRAAVVGVAALALLSCGCMDRNVVKHRAEIKPRAGKVVFIPLRDAENYYFDSEPGGAISEGAAIALEKYSARYTPVNYASARGIIRSDILHDGDNIDWGEVARACEADYVVYGSVDGLSWVDNFTPGLIRCNFIVTYRVYDATAGKVIYGVTKAGAYPSGRLFRSSTVTAYWKPPEEFKTESYVVIGKTIAGTFATYETEGLQEAGIAAKEIDKP